jgi:glycerol kinase
VWGSLDDISTNWQLDAEFHPTDDRTTAEATYREWRRAVERSRGWADGR